MSYPHSGHWLDIAVSSILRVATIPTVIARCLGWCGPADGVIVWSVRTTGATVLGVVCVLLRAANAARHAGTVATGIVARFTELNFDPVPAIVEGFLNVVQAAVDTSAADHQLHEPTDSGDNNPGLDCQGIDCCPFKAIYRLNLQACGLAYGAAIWGCVNVGGGAAGACLAGCLKFLAPTPVGVWGCVIGCSAVGIVALAACLGAASLAHGACEKYAEATYLRDLAENGCGEPR